MAFRFCESMIEEYWTQGFMNLRGIVPAVLRHDLRREADKARILARANLGPQAPRLTAIDQYADRIDLTPFRDYCELPELCNAITRIFGDGFIPSRVDAMSILIEPLDHSWVHGWHCAHIVKYQPRATLHHNCHSTNWKGFSDFKYDWSAIRRRASAAT